MDSVLECLFGQNSLKDCAEKCKIALFHYIFDKIKASPLLIKGEQPFRNSDFKGSPPIFDGIPFITNWALV